jgi:hypothetical protein
LEAKTKTNFDIADAAEVLEKSPLVVLFECLGQANKKKATGPQLVRPVLKGPQENCRGNRDIF